MYKQIIVPLDGSKLAETAITHARDLAKAFQAHLILLSIVKPARPVPYWPTAPYGESPVSTDTEFEVEEAIKMDDLKEIADAEGYLNKISSHLKKQGVIVDIIVEKGADAASSICDYAKQFPHALIVISTHGRSGIDRWVYGSVTARVLRYAKTPVLVVRAMQK